MAKSLAKRFFMLVLTLLLVTVLAFAAFSIIPGDPTSAILGVEATEEQIAALRARLGLDLPLWQRYGQWVMGFFTGNLGDSYNFSMPVAELLAPRITVTLTLAALAMAMTIGISLPMGILAARFSGSPLDRALTLSNQVVMSVPGFLMGIGLTYVFGLLLHWFVPGNFVAPEQNAGEYVRYLLFPALAVALPKSAMTIKLLRSSILGELGSDYVRTAYSKGNTAMGVLWRHVLRNAMIPVVTFLAMAVADIVAGSIVVEQVFAVPGLGQMLISSIGNRDYPVVQAIVVLLAAVVVLCNYGADLLYRVMDPRLRGR